MEHGYLYQALIYLSAAVISVPISKRLGLGSVLGYLIAGIFIGPYVFKLVGEEGQDVMHFAEYGVVMMLFVIGLELQPTLLWRLRAPIFGLGGLQVVTAGAAGCLVGVVSGLSWQMGLACGLILGMSSTAIVLQTLQEKKLMNTPGGKASFAVLLFQDMAVIPILALLPLLAYEAVASGEKQTPAVLQALMTLGAVTGIVLAGRYLMRPVFRLIAETKIRELFTAAALLLVIGISILMEKVGLSPALGAFIGGVVLANSEYRHELESDIEPFKGLLLGLFFISVGVMIDFRLVAENPIGITGLVLLLLAIKFGFLYLLGKIFGLIGPDKMLLSLGLAQGGEFALVLLSFAHKNQVVFHDISARLTAVVALSMAITPVLYLLYDWFAKRWKAEDKVEREADQIDESDHQVIIAGFGRFGSTVGRFLRSHGIGSTVLDLDTEQVEILGRLGLKVYYGDASRLDLLHAAGAEKAKILIVAVNEPEKTNLIVETARKHFPHLKLLVRVQDRSHAYEMINHGIEHVYREVFDSSLICAGDAYRLIGGTVPQAARSMRVFRSQDEKNLRRLAHLIDDEGNMFDAARKVLQEEEQLLKSGLDTEDEPKDDKS